MILKEAKPMIRNNTFLKQIVNYKDLLIYKKSICISDIAYYFANHFYAKGDRTIDQMVQAAHSCKQNIVEGNAAAPTSRETEIKLTNVAKASLQELLEDYKDYLRQHGEEQWHEEDIRFKQTRNVCSKHNESNFFISRLPQRSAATIANIAIIMICQEDYLLYRYIERLKQNFLEQGGIREEMSRARKEYRGY
jgi:four helix bundle suffix protein